MKKVLRIALGICAAAALLCSCTKNQESDGKAALKSISFTTKTNPALTENYEGVIDDAAGTIKFVMPQSTDLHALIPTFKATKGDVVSVNGVTLKSDKTAVNCSSAVTVVVSDSSAKAEKTYTLTVSQNDGVAELVSAGLYKADNVDLLDADYVAGTITDVTIIRIKGGGNGKTLNIRLAAGLNDAIKVNNAKVKDIASVDCDFPIDVVVTDTVANVNKSYVIKVGKILEMVWSKATGFADDTNISTSDYAMAVDAEKDEIYLLYGINGTVGATATTSMATVSKWNGSAWTTVGTSCFSQAKAAKFAIDVVGSQPYVMFTDNGAEVSGTVSVITYASGSWSYVGARGFGEKPNSFGYGIVVNPETKRPITAWSNNAAGANVGKRGLNVSVFGGTDWTANQNISGRTASWYGMVPRFVTVGNAVYLWVANQNQNTYSLYKYASGSWSTVVESYMNAGNHIHVGDNAIAADSQGNIYVAILDDSAAAGTWYIQLFKLNGATFEKVGSPINNSYGTSGSSYALVLDHNDMPIVAYIDQSASGRCKIVTMDAETKSWGEPFDTGITANTSSTVCLDKAGNGSIYVSFAQKLQNSASANYYEYEIFKYSLEPDVLPK